MRTPACLFLIIHLCLQNLNREYDNVGIILQLLQRWLFGIRNVFPLAWFRHCLICTWFGLVADKCLLQTNLSRQIWPLKQLTVAAARLLKKSWSEDCIHLVEIYCFKFLAVTVLHPTVNGGELGSSGQLEEWDSPSISGAVTPKKFDESWNGANRPIAWRKWQAFFVNHAFCK